MLCGFAHPLLAPPFVPYDHKNKEHLGTHFFEFKLNLSLVLKQPFKHVLSILGKTGLGRVERITKGRHPPSPTGALASPTSPGLAKYYIYLIHSTVRGLAPGSGWRPDGDWVATGWDWMGQSHPDAIQSPSSRHPVPSSRGARPVPSSPIQSQPTPWDRAVTKT